jgi:hypothetical protein
VNFPERSDWKLLRSLHRAAREPLRHSSFGAVMEWRLATFTYQNARDLVRATLSLCARAAVKGKDCDERLKNYCTGLDRLLSDAVARWSPRSESWSLAGQMRPNKRLQPTGARREDEAPRLKRMPLGRRARRMVVESQT